MIALHPSRHNRRQLQTHNERQQPRCESAIFGLSIVELNLHPHLAHRFDPVRLLGLDASRSPGFENFIPAVLEPEPQLSFKNADDAPGTCLRAMLPAEGRRERRLIENCRGAIRFHAASLMPVSWYGDGAISVSSTGRPPSSLAKPWLTSR